MFQSLSFPALPTTTALQLKKSKTEPIRQATEELGRSTEEVEEENVDAEASEKRDYLIFGDFEKAWGRHSSSKLHRAWKFFNYSKKEFVEIAHLSRRLTRFFRSVIYLKQSFDSFRAISENLEVSFSFLITVILLFVFLLIFEFDFTSALSIYVSLLAVSALLGRNIFVSFVDGVYLIFIVSPFSVGDVISINDTRYTVKQIYVLSSILEDGWGNTTIFTNSSLHESKIVNYTRSKTPSHNLKIFLSEKASPDDIRKIYERFKNFCEEKLSADVGDVSLSCVFCSPHFGAGDFHAVLCFWGRMHLGNWKLGYGYLL